MKPRVAKLQLALLLSQKFYSGLTTPVELSCWWSVTSWVAELEADVPPENSLGSYRLLGSS
jgi:hypothetical protein